jgi:hypothetical protein
MVLHCATHLFYEGEFERGLRDLTDFDRLMEHFGRTESQFESQLAARALELQLIMPLRYAFRYANLFLGTAIPGEIAELFSCNPVPSLKLALMDELFVRALSPDTPSCQDRLTPMARLLLFVRGHWLRMPVHLLVPHLTRKFFMKRGRHKTTGA